MQQPRGVLSLLLWTHPTMSRLHTQAQAIPRTAVLTSNFSALPIQSCHYQVLCYIWVFGADDAAGHTFASLAHASHNRGGFRVKWCAYKRTFRRYPLTRTQFPISHPTPPPSVSSKQNTSCGIIWYRHSVRVLLSILG